MFSQLEKICLRKIACQILQRIKLQDKTINCCNCHLSIGESITKLINDETKYKHSIFQKLSFSLALHIFTFYEFIKTSPLFHECCTEKIIDSLILQTKLIELLKLKEFLKNDSFKRDINVHVSAIDMLFFFKHDSDVRSNMKKSYQTNDSNIGDVYRKCKEECQTIYSLIPHMQEALHYGLMINNYPN